VKPERASPTPTLTLEEIRQFCWKKGDLSYMLWEQQLPVYRGIRGLPQNVDEAVMVISRQFGKSFLECVLATEDAVAVENCCVPIFGPTIEQCRDIVNPRMEMIAKECPFPGMIRRAKSEDKWYVGKSEIQICGFDANSSSNRGKTVKRDCYVEEVVDSSPDRFMESMRSDIGPALTHSETGRIVYATTLPKLPDHPFITQVIPKAKLANAYWTYTIYDNKKLSRAQFVKCAKRSGCLVDEEGNITWESIDWRREYMCEVVRDGSITILPDFDIKRHVLSCSLPTRCNLETFIDWGGVRDKTVALLVYYNFVLDKLVVVDEASFPPNTATSVIVEGILAMEARWGEVKKRYADAPGQLHVDLRAAGFEVVSPPKADWQAGVNNLQVMFRLNKIEINKICRLLITTCESGQFNRQRNDFGRESAELGHCDAIAALMYAARAYDRSCPYEKQESNLSNFAAKLQPVNFLRRKWHETVHK
jgi:hypothetical protein